MKKIILGVATFFMGCNIDTNSNTVERTNNILEGGSPSKIIIKGQGILALKDNMFYAENGIKTDRINNTLIITLLSNNSSSLSITNLNNNKSSMIIINGKVYDDELYSEDIEDKEMQNYIKLSLDNVKSIEVNAQSSFIGDINCKDIDIELNNQSSFKGDIESKSIYITTKSQSSFKGNIKSIRGVLSSHNQSSIKADGDFVELKKSSNNQSSITVR